MHGDQYYLEKHKVIEQSRLSVIKCQICVSILLGTLGRNLCGVYSSCSNIKSLQHFTYLNVTFYYCKIILPLPDFSRL